jgi:hypothetical protein
MLNDYRSETIAYMMQYEKLVELRSTFDVFNRQLAHNNLFDGATQLQKKTLWPAVEVIDRLKQVYEALESQPNGRRLAYAFYKQERDVADAVARGILRHFTDLTPDRMAHWLASSNGFVVFADADLAPEVLAAFIDKLKMI